MQRDVGVKRVNVQEANLFAQETASFSGNGGRSIEKFRLLLVDSTAAIDMRATSISKNYGNKHIIKVNLYFIRLFIFYELYVEKLFNLFLICYRKFNFII